MSNIFNKKNPFFSSNNAMTNISLKNNIEEKNYITGDEYKGPINYYPSSNKE